MEVYMATYPLKKRFGSAVSVGLGLFLLVCAGCGQRAGDGPTTRPVPRVGDVPARLTPEQVDARRTAETNILNIYTYYNPYTPWIWNENHNRVVGVIIGALYLQGPNGRGVFGNGIIRPRLYIRDRKAANPEDEWKVVKEWSFDVDEAYLFRSIKPTVQGYGYMLPLRWGEDLNLADREVRLIISFERADGMVVRSSPRDFGRVPLKGT